VRELHELKADELDKSKPKSWQSARPLPLLRPFETRSFCLLSAVASILISTICWTCRLLRHLLLSSQIYKIPKVAQLLAINISVFLIKHGCCTTRRPILLIKASQKAGCQFVICPCCVAPPFEIETRLLALGLWQCWQ